MKANFSNSFAKRSLVIVAAALPSSYAGLASAQAAAPAPPPAAPPAVVAAPAPAPPPAPVAAPAPATAAPAPAVVTPPAPDVPPAPPEVPPPDPNAEKYKHINMGIWMRVGAAIQDHNDPKKLKEIGTGGTMELHFSNQMRKSLQWTANLVAGYGAPDGGSFHAGGGSVNGTVSVLDLIAQYEPDDAFHLWVGRMLVPSDRANFSGPWFSAPWIYPLFLGPQGAPYAVVGPKEGPSGRNDGATVWGQFSGGLFKYYLGAYNMYDAAQKPLISGRLNLSLLNPEPGYYHSSTYYGQDILAIGVGGQYQKNGDANLSGMGLSDYGLFNADLLFEKNLGQSGVIDVEGAFYKYVGDGEAMKASHFVLLSYLTPDVGIGKFQPLVRVQQAFFKDDAPTVTQVDAQVADVIDAYATRVTLGFSHAGAGSSGPVASKASNAIFAGIQLQK